MGTFQIRLSPSRKIGYAFRPFADTEPLKSHLEVLRVTYPIVALTVNPFLGFSQPWHRESEISIQEWPIL
jgi:hypothetical protein